jgi:hypothetical protein
MSAPLHRSVDLVARLDMARHRRSTSMPDDNITPTVAQSAVGSRLCKYSCIRRDTDVSQLPARLHCFASTFTANLSPKLIGEYHPVQSLLKTNWAPISLERLTGIPVVTTGLGFVPVAHETKDPTMSACTRKAKASSARQKSRAVRLRVFLDWLSTSLRVYRFHPDRAKPQDDSNIV